MSPRTWTLRNALQIERRPELVALVGGGGKTSLMFALASELPGRRIVTTTTRIFAAQMKHPPVVLSEHDLSRLDTALATHGYCLVIGRVDGDKALGVEPDLPAQLLARPDVDYVIVEADGSRMRPVKVPAAHEPVMPLGTSLLAPLAGMDALEGPIDQVAHRPERVRNLLRGSSLAAAMEPGRHRARRGEMIDSGDVLTATGLAHLLTHPQGGMKDAPATARVIPFLNKVESAGRLAAARAVAQQMLEEPRISRVVVGALQSESPVREVWRRVAGVILAAGEAKRMGRNKLLLPWGQTTVLGQTIANVARSGLHSCLAVTGYEHEHAEAIARAHGVETRRNDDYATGMITSVQAAVRHLPETVEALMVVLGDQPMVSPAIIDELIQAYAAGPKGLVAPAYRGKRGNPVVIDRRFFTELLALPPDDAPRTLLKRHPDELLTLDVAEESILRDLDWPQDYERYRP